MGRSGLFATHTKNENNKAWKIIETCKVIKKYVVVCG